jgi:shikimate kinase
MGSGKTTVAKKLARSLQFNFLDMDEVFEEKYHIQVADFFQKYDEQAFREIESKLIKETESLENTVISTGGGAPCFHDNLQWMKNSGIIVYLQMSVAALVNRLSNAKRVRPLIKDLNDDELNDYITEQLKMRDEFYTQAQIIINGENCDIETLATSIKYHPLFK